MAFTEIDLFHRALSRVGSLRITLAAAKTVSSATAANPVVCSSTAHGYSNGDLVLLTEFDQMTPVNGRVFEISNVSANAFTLTNEDGSAYTAESSGGLAQKLSTGKHVTACFDAWKGVVGDGVRDEVLRMHPWNSATQRVRLARLQAAKTVTGATAANPVVITAVAHGYATGDFVKLENLGGMVEVNDRFFTGTVLTVDTFSIGVDGTLFTAYTSGGTAKKALVPLKPDFGFGARYSLPSDFLAVVQLAPESATGVPVPATDYTVEGLELLCDLTNTVPLRYIARIKDPTRFDSLLVSALVARLALEIFEDVTTQGNAKRGQIEQSWEDILAKAQRSNAREKSGAEFETDPWILARF